MSTVLLLLLLKVVIEGAERGFGDRVEGSVVSEDGEEGRGGGGSWGKSKSTVNEHTDKLTSQPSISTARYLQFATRARALQAEVGGPRSEVRTACGGDENAPMVPPPDTEEPPPPAPPVTAATSYRYVVSEMRPPSSN